MTTSTEVDLAEAQVVDALVEHLRAHHVGADDRWDAEALQALHSWVHAATT